MQSEMKNYESEFYAVLKFYKVKKKKKTELIGSTNIETNNIYFLTLN